MDPVSIISNLLHAAIDGRRASVPSGLSRDDWERILGICAAQRVHTFAYDALPEEGMRGEILPPRVGKIIENELKLF